MIYFAGSNSNKAEEYKRYLGNEVCFEKFECDEIQHINVEVIARQKATDAFRTIKKSLFVDDTGLYIDGLGGMPGPFVTWFISAMGSQGIAKICSDNRAAQLRTCIAYADNNGSISTFLGEISGSLATKCRGTNGFGFDNIFVPSGHRLTLAEMSDNEKDTYNPRLNAAFQLKKFIEER